MLTALTILATNVIFTGHVAVLHPQSKSGSVAAIAPRGHATRIVIAAGVDSGIESWDPNGSGLRLRSAVLPGVGNAGRAALSIELPENSMWDVVVSDSTNAPTVTDKLSEGTNKALRMKDLRTIEAKGKKADTDPASYPAGARARMLLTAGDAVLANYEATSDFKAATFECQPPNADKKECAWDKDNPAQLTDRVEWRTAKAVTITWIPKHRGALAPRMTLKPNAEVWLINDAIESGAYPPAGGTEEVTHLIHYYDWLKIPGAGTKYVLKRQKAIGPIFCPPIVIEYE